jgi:hypothetical protein
MQLMYYFDLFLLFFNRSDSGVCVFVFFFTLRVLFKVFYSKKKQLNIEANEFYSKQKNGKK